MNRVSRTTEPFETVVTAAEETARIETRDVVTGRVRIETRVETLDETLRATLDGEVVEVRHVPVGATVTAVPDVRTEGDLTVIPVVEEVLVVEKRLVLREEIHIRRRRETQEIAVPVTVRRQSVEITRESGEPTAEE